MNKTPEEITKALLEPFPANALKRRSDRGSTFTYVEGQTVIRRLIDATGNAFDVDVVEQSITPYGQTAKGKDRVIITARVRLTVPGLGSREHMGVQVTSVDSGEDLYKGAISDAIKKAATLFGVGLDLYGPDYEAGEVDDRAPAQRPALRQDAPQTRQIAPGRTEAPSPWSTLVRAAAYRQISEESLREYFTARGVLSVNGAPVGIEPVQKLTAWIETHTLRQIQDHFRDVISQRNRPPKSEVVDTADDPGMDDDDYAQVVASIDAEQAPDRAALAAHYTS